MFTDHLLEVFNGFQRYVIFFVSEIHECTSVGAVGWNDDFDGPVRVYPRLATGAFLAGSKREQQRKREFRNPNSETIPNVQITIKNSIQWITTTRPFFELRISVPVKPEPERTPFARACPS